MRIVFMGTPDFSVPTLHALHEAGHDIAAVYSQPPRPAGRGKQLQPSPVHRAAEALGIEVRHPLSLRDLDAQAEFLALQPDVAVVVAYGLILPQPVLDAPKHGCLNVHASLLPRWRGAAPIQRAIEAGDTQTGVTIMQMDEGLDTGDMLLTRELPITEAHTGAVLHDELAQLGAEAIVEAIARLERGELVPRPQPEHGVTYAAKLDKAEAALDFSQSAESLARRVRAFDPVPGATMMLPGLEQAVKIWSATALPDHADAAPGTILGVSAQGIDVATAQGVLRVLALQKAGGKRQPVSAFVQGWSLP